jgi:hypothetical protein
MLTRPEHSGNQIQMERAKSALCSLPVVPGGVSDVPVISFTTATGAAREYMRRNPGVDSRVRQRIVNAGIWIGYRFGNVSMNRIAEMTGRPSGRISQVIGRVDDNIREGGQLCEIVNSILQIIVQKDWSVGRADEAPVRRVVRPKRAAVAKAHEQIEEPCDPVVAKILYWRGKGASVKSIARWEGLDPAYVAKVVGVQWGRVET